MSTSSNSKRPSGRRPSSPRLRWVLLISFGIAAWAALMLSTAGTALFPGMLKLAAPIVCAPGYRDSAVAIVKSHPRMGTTVWAPRMFCIDRQEDWVPVDTAYAMAATFPIFLGAMIMLGGLGVLLSGGRLARKARTIAGRATSALVLVVAVWATGCSWGTVPLSEYEKALERSRERHSLLTSPELSGVLQALSEKLGSAEIRATSLTIHQRNASFEVQDPKRPENLDRYDFDNGVWKEPRPVRVSGGRALLEQRLFSVGPAGAPALVMLPQLVRETEAKLAIEGFKVTNVSMSPAPPDAAGLSALHGPAGVRIRVHGSSPRKSGSVEFDGLGAVVRVFRD